MKIWPGKTLCEAVKSIFRYLKRQYKSLLAVSRHGSIILVSGFLDADYAGFLDTGGSLIRYMFLFCGSTVIWKANPEHMVSLSTTAAESIAVVEAIKEATRDSYEVEDKPNGIHLVMDRAIMREQSTLDERLRCEGNIGWME